MSGRIVGEVLRHAPADLTPLELLVLVALADAALDKDRLARKDAHVDALADKTRSTPGSVRNVLSRLRERGLIVPLVEKPAKGRAQTYRLLELHEGTRRAVIGAPVVPIRKASPGSDVNGSTKRHQGVTW